MLKMVTLQSKGCGCKAWSFSRDHQTVCISRGLISVQCFQLIHTSSCCADSVGVGFFGTCAYVFIVHVAMVTLVNNNLQSMCHIVDW